MNDDPEFFNPARHFMVAQERRPNGLKKCACTWAGANIEMHFVAMRATWDVLAPHEIEEEP